MDGLGRMAETARLVYLSPGASFRGAEGSEA